MISSIDCSFSSSSSSCLIRVDAIDFNSSEFHDRKAQKVHFGWGQPVASGQGVDVKSMKKKEKKKGHLVNETNRWPPNTMEMIKIREMISERKGDDVCVCVCVCVQKDEGEIMKKKEEENKNEIDLE